MRPNHRAKAKHSKLRNSGRTTTVAAMPSMFNNAHNTHITGGSFNITSTFNSINGQSLDMLYSRVAPNAILNSGGRADSVRCHPGTRQEVIGRIKKWRADAQQGLTANRIFWLSGPAGAGKTAIVQTVAESWKLRGIPAANFFFFRTDASRNHAGSLISTLLYQMFDFYPAMRGVVEKILDAKPRLLDASVEEQFDQLICIPFRSASFGQSLSQSIVLLVDGLDECDSEEKTSQHHILHALDRLVSQIDLPFLVLVSSRVEHQITIAFNALCSTVDSIFLDDKYSPEEDIRLFVTAEFDKIKRTHPLAPQDDNWPTPSDVNRIVKTSSGQFIYASTVMRFLLQSSTDPKVSLSKVRGAADIATKSPFSHLDAMYTYILSQAEDPEALRGILCAYAVCEYDKTIDLDLLRNPRLGGTMLITTLKQLLCLYDSKYTNYDIASCLADIAAIARVDDGELRFYHSSLLDYLETQSRSGKYYLDVDAFTIRILPGVWKLARSVPQVYTLPDACIDLLSRSKTIATSSLLDALLLVEPSDHEDVSIQRFSRIFSRCASEEDVTKYRQVLRKWVTYHMSIDRPTLALDQLYRLPHGRRYITMARIDSLYGDVSQNPDLVDDALFPSSAFEADETSLWVQNLLWRVHEEYYSNRLETYTHLISQWIAWALSNGIALANLDDLPHCQQYLQQDITAK